LKKTSLIIIVVLATLSFPWSRPAPLGGEEVPFLLTQFSTEDVILVADHGGRILLGKNETKKYVPASTLKIITGLAALHHMGEGYRFETAFYLDGAKDLIVKGYGDPLLVSEVWQAIAGWLAPMLSGCRDVILDHSYFAPRIFVPGVGHTANPYDAPVGALCANFNTVVLEEDETGRTISGEPQTPITPLMLRNVRTRGLVKGRHAFTQESEEAALYAGELLVYFLQERGVHCGGEIRTGAVARADKHLYTFRSPFTLREAVHRMLEYSNNFMANQILIALGAHVHGPPATLAKGVDVVSRYAQNGLCLRDVKIVEGSGISRRNRLCAEDMLTVLKAFEPYRVLLNRQGNLLYKSGSLEGVKTRAGYITCETGSYYFVICLQNPCRDIDWLTNQLADSLCED
jgi:D-alanyl-D-alanine carboxypeptidase/D-alanyl-D-alanine-endopeptidase (penicillin-binding protein 4)